MLNYGLIKLIESGQVTNAYKSIDRGKSVWTFAFPVDVQWYFNTVDRNQHLAAYDISHTNNFQILSRIDNMIAINNCVAVDLLGQQCAGFYEKTADFQYRRIFPVYELLRHVQGGQGVASMTSGANTGTPRIVPFLPEGSNVHVPAELQITSAPNMVL